MQKIEDCQIITQHLLKPDRKGIVYAIGCVGGAWKNPVSTRKINISASSIYRGNVAMVADHSFACQIFYTENKLHSWIRIDFQDFLVCPSAYSLAHRAGYDGYYLRDWQLQASNDLESWTTLKEHFGDESISKKNCVASWPIENISQLFFRYFQVVLTPNGNSSGTNALVLSCFEIFGLLKYNKVGKDQSFSLPMTSASSELSDVSFLCTGKVISVNWQGGLILSFADNAGPPISYHKSDVWVDEKKVKQLPREGDIVSFYVSTDEASKIEKAEQVTVLNHFRQNASITHSVASEQSGNCSKLNPAAPSYSPSPQTPEKESQSNVFLTPSPNARSAATFHNSKTKSSFRDDIELRYEKKLEKNIENSERATSSLFEHCIGRVMSVSVPNGHLKLDGTMHNSPLITYHYSDVWDDGKCVKQFPRVGDIVSCYVGIDPKTKKEKAEMVKVLHKQPALEDEKIRATVKQHASRMTPSRIEESVYKGPTEKPFFNSPGGYFDSPAYSSRGQYSTGSPLMAVSPQQLYSAASSKQRQFVEYAPSSVFQMQMPNKNQSFLNRGLQTSIMPATTAADQNHHGDVPPFLSIASLPAYGEAAPQQQPRANVENYSNQIAIQSSNHQYNNNEELLVKYDDEDDEENYQNFGASPVKMKLFDSDTTDIDELAGIMAEAVLSDEGGECSTAGLSSSSFCSRWSPNQLEDIFHCPRLNSGDKELLERVILRAYPA